MGGPRASRSAGLGRVAPTGLVLLLGAGCLGGVYEPLGKRERPTGALLVAPTAGRGDVRGGTPGEEVLRVRWRFHLTDPALIEYKPQEFSVPASDGSLVFVGGRGGHFYALRASDGAQVWRQPIAGGVMAPPLHVPETNAVYVGGGDGALHAFDARNGRELWAYPTKGTIGTAPVVHEGLVFFTNGEDRVYALDAQSGAWRWQYEREAPEGFTVRGSAGAAVVGGRVCTGFADGYVACLKARTGDLVWTRSLAGDAKRFVDVDSTPTAAGDLLLASSYSGGVYGLQPSDGTVRWHFPVEGAGTLRSDGKRVYFAAVRAGLHCLDMDGHLVWRQAIEGQGELSAPFLLGARHLLLSASDTGMYVVDRESGRLRQLFNPGHGVTSPPAADARQLYVVTNVGTVFAFAWRP